MKTIDITPTWAAIIRIYIEALEHGDQKGREAARIEIQRLATIADTYVAMTKDATIRTRFEVSEDNYGSIIRIEDGKIDGSNMKSISKAMAFVREVKAHQRRRKESIPITIRKVTMIEQTVKTFPAKKGAQKR